MNKKKIRKSIKKIYREPEIETETEIEPEIEKKPTDYNDVLNEKRKQHIISSYNFTESIIINWIFYGSLLLCSLVISLYSKHSFTLIIINIIISSLFGYFIHVFSHKLNFTDMYSGLDNYISRNSVLHFITLKICAFLDFHDKTHHNTKINKTFKNISYEFFNNIMFQGGFIILFIYCVKYLCIPSIILWTFLYATVHNINYAIYPCKTHQNHHINKHSSYGLDVWDILFNTNDDPNEIENYNHASINLIIITLIICFYYKFM